jgi:hypothetical protein
MSTEYPATAGGGDEPIVPVPIPPLATLLADFERQKGSPLSEVEVLAVRDEAVCMNMRLSRKLAMDAARGYRDLDPQDVWHEWLEWKAQLGTGAPTEP